MPVEVSCLEELQIGDNLKGPLGKSVVVYDNAHSQGVLFSEIDMRTGETSVVYASPGNATLGKGRNGLAHLMYEQSIKNNKSYWREFFNPREKDLLRVFFPGIGKGESND